MARVTGVGYFEFYLNSEKVGDHVLDPAVTRYDKRVKYQVFDVLSYLDQGSNIAGGIVGNGFYNVDTESAWDFDEAPWRNSPAFFCQIDIVYENGKTDTVSTDSSWKFATGPIIFDQIRNGETYDANRELIGWADSGYDDSEWKDVFVGNGTEGVLSEQIMPPIRKTRTLRPVTIAEPRPGIFLVDFGQNISGWAKIRVSEEKGREIILRYGERISKDGSLDQKELSRFIFTGETQTTRYIANGREKQIYEPRFVYFGFQYVEIEGLSRALNPADIEAFMIHTDFEEAGYFECSNPLFNQIHENIKWSYLGNYHSYPEDCPHREKMGWTGDGQLAVETGLYNFDALTAYMKWLRDHADEQRPDGDLPGIIPTSGWGYNFGRNPETRSYGYGPHWEGSAIVIPWHLYRHTGDEQILHEFYPMMKKYLGHLEKIAQDYLLEFGIDDHKSIITHTDGGYISSAYFHQLSDIMRQVAGVLGLDDEAEKFASLQKNIAASFNKKYFHPETDTYGSGGQTQMALALACGLVPEELRIPVFDNLLVEIERRDYHFDCGVVGLRKLIDVLIDFDRKDVLYEMVDQKDFPSFGYWIEQGANTMWQNWDGSQSRNHIMFGSIGDYFYRGLAGINPAIDTPGFEKIVLTPQFPPDLSYLKCGHKTPFGWVRTGWSKSEGRISYELSVPEGTLTEFTIPFRESEVKSQGKNIDCISGIKILKSGSDFIKCSVSPGNFEFEINVE